MFQEVISWKRELLLIVVTFGVACLITWGYILMIDVFILLMK